MRWLTAGESHGPGLTAILEGLPAGVPVSSATVQHDLARRRLGVGRGSRQKFEQDELSITGGVVHGVSIGGPVALVIGNTEWPKWREVMSADDVPLTDASRGRSAPLTRPRPGHADLTGMQKYGFDEARPVLERASARETAARVALGAVARAFLNELGVHLLSHVVSIGPVAVPAEAPVPRADAGERIDADPVRCADPATSALMVAEIDDAHRAGDTLGGVVEVVVHGLPPGLGSYVHWDRRLDARLAAALMGIQAIKGVEVGDGFETARRRGSAAHDELVRSNGTIERLTDRAGGTEGGMTTGDVLRVRAAMKPISTVPHALRTVDVASGEVAAAHHQRSDVCAVPAAGVVAEAMVALVLADAALEKFGGDSLAETRRNLDAYLAAIPPALRTGPQGGVGRTGRRSGAMTVAVPRTIALIGPMGAGKTSVGRRLAKHLDRRFADTDAAIVAEHGPIAELFAIGGEAAFRRIEREVVARELAAGGVVALGGGAVLDTGTREALAECVVVLLTVSQEAVAERLASGRRPLLRDGIDSWRRIADERAALYAELADLTVDTSRRPMAPLAAELAAQLRTAVAVSAPVSDAVRIPVTNAGEYEVVIGRDLGDLLAGALPAGARKALVVHQPVQTKRAETIRERLAGRVEVLLAEVPDAEDAKRIEVASFCWQVLGQADFTRSDVVIGLGGGAVTDLAGFVAATWLRGIALVTLPTSVLGMVDAAVGGKTGLNTAEGKNLVGAFHAPVAVLADLDVLDTLPRNDLLAGFAEIAKCGFIADTAILDALVADVDAATDPQSAVFADLVVRAVRVKAEVVSEDFRESGRREMLNYGHTLGHAIEYAERYRWRHGAAIAVGMVFSAELARLVGRLDDDAVELHRQVLDSLSLPTGYPAGRWPTLTAAMRRDKKSRAGLLRFVLLDGIGRTSILNGPEDHLLFTAYSELAL